MKKSEKRSLKKRKKNSTNPHISRYKIVFDAIEEDIYPIPNAIQETLQNAYDQIHAKKAQQVIETLEALKEQYPGVPQIYNYLAVAYNSIGDKESLKQIVQDNYQAHPDYLFAQINYAQQCIKEDQFEKIPEIFDHKFDLKLLYPKRETFHVTEYMGLMGIVCVYFNHIGKKKEAKLVYDSLIEVDPDDNVLKFVRAHLYPSFAQNLIRLLQNEPKVKNTENPQSNFEA